MFTTPGKPGPFALTATVEGETVFLMKGRSDAPTGDLGALEITALPRVLAELRASIARPNPLATKWGMAGLVAYQEAQKAGFKGRPSVFADLIEASGTTPLDFAKAFSTAARIDPRILKMPYSGAFAHLLRAGKGVREAADSIAALEQGIASGFGGRHGAKVLAEILSGQAVREAPSNTGDAIMTINLTTGEIAFPPDIPRPVAVRRAMEILLQQGE